MVTPLKDRDTLDLAGLERLVEHILAGGVHGLFVLGTTGEGPSLSYRLRCELIDRVCGQVDGRVPVLVGVTDTAFVESVNLAGHAADAARGGRAGRTVLFSRRAAGIAVYLQTSWRNSRCRFSLYNMPSHTKLAFEPDIVRRLMDLPSIVGLKDSSGDMVYFHRIRRLVEDRDDWTLLMGPEQLLAEAVAVGGDGGVCGGANLCPKLFVDLYEAARARRTTPDRRVARPGEGDFRDDLHGRQSWIGVHQGAECALACLGVCDDAMAEPFQRFGEAQREQVRRHLVDLGLLGDGPAAAPASTAAIAPPPPARSLRIAWPVREPRRFTARSAVLRRSCAGLPRR